MSNHFTSIRHSPFAIFGRRRSPDRAQSGVALILTLAILALVTLLVVAFVTSMRVENMASKNYNSVMQARELAKGAIDQAVAQIRQATPERSDSPISTYVTFPGGAYIYQGTAQTFYPLYSDPSLGDPVNLNANFWITGGKDGKGEFTTAVGSQINVGWLYVAQDGTVSKGPGPGAGHGPIVGRIAYWVDDEASKVNVNTAGAPPYNCSDSFGICSSNSDVDLSVLPGLSTYAASIPGGTTPQPYTTVAEVQRANPGITNVFDDNRFEMTAYSNDGNFPLYNDDLDIFGRQRLVLNPTILGTPANFNTAVNELSDANLATFYGASGSGFGAKYTTANAVQQLMANIIGYQIDPTSVAPPTDGSLPPKYLGLAKTPYINQIQIQYTITPGSGSSPATVARNVSVALYYPYAGRYSSNGEQITLAGLPDLSPPVGFSSSVTININPTAINNGTPITFTWSDGPLSVSGSPSAPAANTVVIQYRRGYLLDYAQIPLIPRNTQLNVTTGGTFYQGAQVVGDPAVHDSANEWTTYTSLPSPASGYPPIDVSKVFMRAAPMQSVGELGYIHVPGIANQHLSLLQNGTTSQIPDWALLDLFTVGAGGIGRININSFINPGAVTANPTLPRLAPLDAMLNSLSSVISPLSVAQTIYTDNRSPSYGMQGSSGHGIFNSIGEICELSALVPSSANTLAAKEQVIQRIANLITVRSNTFTIWAVAQSIKQPPGATLGTFTTGLDQITGEVRAQAVLERYESNPGVTGSVPKYRLRYFRYL
ncbi:MAG TPA: hypothetical protein VMP11_19005 [Verrucomicrobiae bacterium]|nr:hypothetical protein [Verrucomicrobiae bacterium]